MHSHAFAACIMTSDASILVLQKVYETLKNILCQILDHRPKALQSSALPTVHWIAVVMAVWINTGVYCALMLKNYNS